MLHFTIAGAILFGSYHLLNRGEPEVAGIEPVHIGEGEVRWLRETFANQWQREPTGEELKGLVASLLEEELLAREARAVGLDQNDTIVRRRLAQKLTFLIEDTAYIVEPTEEELRRFYAANGERFQTEARVSFMQIYFSPARRPSAETDARTALLSIAAADKRIDAALMGDPLLLDADFQDMDRQALSNMFGAEFAEAVFALEPGSWGGPVESGFGAHLVRVTRLRTAELRPFDEVRDKVLEALRQQRQRETQSSYLSALREKYGVVIDDSVKPLLPLEIEKVPTQ